MGKIARNGAQKRIVNECLRAWSVWKRWRLRHRDAIHAGQTMQTVVSGRVSSEASQGSSFYLAKRLALGNRKTTEV